MKTLVGMNIIESKKSGKRFMMLNLLDDTFMNSANHDTQLALFDSPKQTGWGQTVSTEFLNLENMQGIEIQGNLEPGCQLRLFKENVDGIDQITLIQVVGSRKK